MPASARSAGPAFGIEDTLPMPLCSPTDDPGQAFYFIILRLHTLFCLFLCDIVPIRLIYAIVKSPLLLTWGENDGSGELSFKSMDDRKTSRHPAPGSCPGT